MGLFLLKSFELSKISPWILGGDKTVAQPKKIKDPMIKQFRTSQEVENFYRFIHDNSLRHEAKTLLEFVYEKVKKISKKKG